MYSFVMSLMQPVINNVMYTYLHFINWKILCGIRGGGDYQNWGGKYVTRTQLYEVIGNLGASTPPAPLVQPPLVWITKFLFKKRPIQMTVMRVNSFSYSETRKPPDSVHKHYSY